MTRAIETCLLLLPAIATAAGPPGEPATTSVDKVYQGYRPDFIDMQGAPGSLMKLSSEKAFFTRCLIDQSMRANALIEAGIQNEGKGQYRKALQTYQQVIERFPDALFRICPYGVYVPVAYYAQLRILNFPSEHLAFYRVKYDARAREPFEMSKKSFSIESLAHIRDNMLCTSYGADAMLLLGDAELDRGNYLAALEYFTTARKDFPDRDVRTPELALKIAYCRKMLGEKVTPTLPAKTGNTALDAAALKAFLKYVQDSKTPKTELVSQRSSPSAITADDYMHMLPTSDPLGLKKPVWSKPKPGGGLTVDTQPVVTDRSVLYRHLNILYCRSLLNGERWERNPDSSYETHIQSTPFIPCVSRDVTDLFVPRPQIVVQELGREPASIPWHYAYQ